MAKSPLKVGISILICGLVLASPLFIHLAQQRADNDAFVAIEMGDSTLEVVNALGQPDAIRDCSENMYWGGDHKPLGKNDGRCNSEYYYGSMPGGWSVGFSEAGEVVSKYAYVSP